MHECEIGISVFIFGFLWINTYYHKEMWFYIDEIVSFLDNYLETTFKKCISFPKVCIPMHFPCDCPPPCPPTNPPCPPTNPPCPPTNPPCPPTNIINITCGGSNGCSSKISSCQTINPCIEDREVILGGYKYILDKLPGYIFKFKLDTFGCIIKESKYIILHSLGKLNRIYINDGKIIVEDSHSIEYIALILQDGILNF